MFKLYIYLLVLSLGLSHSQLIKKLEISNFDEDEVADIGEFNQQLLDEGLTALEFDEELMSTAQKEAERLAKFEKLALPSFKIRNSYDGHSNKITGLVRDQYSKNIDLNLKNF